MKLIILGAPGAGKGTQAERIVKEYKVAHISTGDLLRAAVAEKTALGVKAKTYMDQGKLVPDELVIGMVKERLAKPDMKAGYLLDGFPRTIEQAKKLEEFAKVDKVLNLVVDENLLVRRITSRLSCKGCKAVFNKVDRKPRKEGSCDLCGSELYTRDDDKEETVKKRLETYHSQTEPLIEYYRNKGLVKDVVGKDKIDDTYAEVKKALK